MRVQGTMYIAGVEIQHGKGYFGGGGVVRGPFKSHYKKLTTASSAVCKGIIPSSITACSEQYHSILNNGATCMRCGLSSKFFDHLSVLGFNKQKFRFVKITVHAYLLSDDDGTGVMIDVLTGGSSDESRRYVDGDASSTDVNDSPTAATWHFILLSTSCMYDTT